MIDMDVEISIDHSNQDGSRIVRDTRLRIRHRKIQMFRLRH